MIRKFAAVGILAVSTGSLSSTAFAESPVPGVDAAVQLINDVTAPLQPILDPAPASAPAPAAAPTKAKRHARAPRAKHHVASRKTKHKAA